jgi:formate hydrogenlyase subunit 3/multisubunit Na+/H+ antiporter MnhD subunit
MSPRLHRQLSLVLCWISLVGNLGTWLTGVGLAAMQRDARMTAAFLCITAMSSFYCAFSLRKIIVRSPQGDTKCL